MKRDDIIRMAVQCQLVNAGNREGLCMDALAEFAELVTEKERNRIWTQDHWTEYERGIAEAERDACAKVAETPVGEYQVIVACGTEPAPVTVPKYLDPLSIAKAIRARGQA